MGGRIKAASGVPLSYISKRISRSMSTVCHDSNCLATNVCPSIFLSNPDRVLPCEVECCALFCGYVAITMISGGNEVIRYLRVSLCAGAPESTSK